MKGSKTEWITEDGYLLQKKQISNEANALIQEYIEKYEKDPSLLDKEAADMLEDFWHLIRPEYEYHLDMPIALRNRRVCMDIWRI